MNKHLGIAIILCLTLGLAPFTPPHLFGKIQWVLGGAEGMKPMDWFDLVLHGSPFIYLMYALWQQFFKKNESKSS